jgi:hypothetical protein
VAQRNRAAVRIHARIVVGKAQFARDRQPLRGEGFIDLDYAELAEGDARVFQQLARRRGRAARSSVRIDDNAPP